MAGYFEKRQGLKIKTEMNGIYIFVALNLFVAVDWREKKTLLILFLTFELVFKASYL